MFAWNNIFGIPFPNLVYVNNVTRCTANVLLWPKEKHCNLTLRWKIKFLQSILCILGDFIFIDTNHNLALTLNLSHAFIVTASISKKSTTGFTPFEPRRSSYAANGTGVLVLKKRDVHRRIRISNSISRRKVRAHRMNNKLRHVPIADTHTLKPISHQSHIFNRKSLDC